MFVIFEGNFGKMLRLRPILGHMFSASVAKKLGCNGQANHSEKVRQIRQIVECEESIDI